ncbi:hypothetical protein Smp_137850 [Schistosoma mansoni]|uniref:Uncharacterized protein n=1 Tax=Schistosoma mansoni TaxID=6183 RepID=G4VGT2_SCHMA|nr:hypothetical protein Smp_137850 [Schistosoma mansoni]|eukprot:XP_018650818.1 hypothetical protein Smp_137850 [Schistosoma mansoni]
MEKAVSIIRALHSVDPNLTTRVFLTYFTISDNMPYNKTKNKLKHIYQTECLFNRINNPVVFAKQVNSSIIYSLPK